MLSKQALLQAYRKMREIRTFEERLHQENTSGDIPGFIHLYTGEEAIAVGVCENLTSADFIGSTHRGHGPSPVKETPTLPVFSVFAVSAAPMARGGAPPTIAFAPSIPFDRSVCWPRLGDLY